MDLNFQVKINKAKRFFGLPDYSKELENFAHAIRPVSDIVCGEDCDEKYVEFIIQKPLEEPVYFIIYREEYINEYSNYP